MYSHEQILYALSYLTRNKKPLNPIRRYIKTGVSYDQFIELYPFPEEVAKVLYVMYSGKQDMRPIYFGHKKEPYYEGDYPPEIPDYKPEDLSGEELLILKSLSNGQNEGDLYKSNE